MTRCAELRVTSLVTSLATALALVGCCAGGAAPIDAASPPSRAHAGTHWIASPTGGSWVWCDVQPVPVMTGYPDANAVRCQLVDGEGRCEAWSTYVYADFRAIDSVPAIDRACVTRITSGASELVEHGRVVLHCADERPVQWFCQLGRCLGPMRTDDPESQPPVFSQLEELPCDVAALH